MEREPILMGYSPWGRKESDTTERLTLFSFQYSTVWLYLLLDLRIVFPEHI